MKVNNETQIVIYQAANGKTRLDVQFTEETVWLNLSQLTELFQRDKSVTSRHINNIFKEQELARASVVAKCATTALDGKTYMAFPYR